MGAARIETEGRLVVDQFDSLSHSVLDTESDDTFGANVTTLKELLLPFDGRRVRLLVEPLEDAGDPGSDEDDEGDLEYGFFP